MADRLCVSSVPAHPADANSDAVHRPGVSDSASNTGSNPFGNGTVPAPAAPNNNGGAPNNSTVLNNNGTVVSNNGFHISSNLSPAASTVAIKDEDSPNGSPPSDAHRKVPKSRSRSSVVQRAKLRQPSFTGSTVDAPGKPLNTHSPVAVAAAAAVTGDKIRKLLVTQGPLPIRHITSHLATTIPGFGELSLSKQRRLIIAVLDAPKSEFVKVGWGRWAVAGSAAAELAPAASSSSATNNRKDSLGASVARALRSASSAHRESISRRLPDNKLPLSPPLHPVDGSAVFSDSESDFEDESEVEDGTDEEDWEAIGPARLRQTSPREQDAIAALVQLKSN